MEEVEKLLEEGRHIEFVDKVVNKIGEEKKEMRRNRQRGKTKTEIWCESKLVNKEVLPLQEQQVVDLSCVLGVYLAKSEELKTTQIRKMLDRFNFIESNKSNFDKMELIKMKPILAYTAARNKATKELIKILDNSINQVKSFEDFEKICEFLRGVVAYHRLAGGSD